jgi:hypothetical protein
MKTKIWLFSGILIIFLLACSKDDLNHKNFIVPLKSEGGIFFQDVYHRPLGSSFLSSGDVLRIENFSNGGVEAQISGNCTWKCKITPIDLSANQAISIQAIAGDSDTGGNLILNNKDVFLTEASIIITYYLNNEIIDTEEVNVIAGEPVFSHSGIVSTVYYTSIPEAETFAFALTSASNISIGGKNVVADKIAITRNGNFTGNFGPEWIRITGDGINALQFERVITKADLCGDIVEIDKEI